MNARGDDRSGVVARAAEAGAIGGAAAGLIDVVLGTSAAGLAPWARVQLCALGAGAGALLGAVVAAVVSASIARTRAVRRAGALMGAGVAAPFAVYDAFAMFSGHRAAQVPAHTLISVALAVLAIAAAAALGAAATVAVASGDARVRRARALAVALAALALALELANRRVLPRLYEWFHVTLAAATFGCALIAARLARAGARSRGRWLPAWLAFGAAALVVGGIGFVRRPSLRFVVAERTMMLGRSLGRLPIGHATQRRAATGSPEALAAGPPLPDGPKRPGADVVIVSIDALRADHVGAYGYGRATTPNLDALAARGVRFNRAYAQAPHTSYSTSTLLTGKYFPTVLRVANASAEDALPWTLRRYGWKTAAFYPPAVFFVDAERLRPFADSHFGFEYVKEEFLDAFARLDQVGALLHAEQPKRLFLWLHLFEPHEPYDARPGHEFGPSDVDRYDSEIAYADAALGRLLALLERERPGAIVIVTADHGEEFDEHGGRYHGSSLHEEQVRVPLVIAVPGVKPHVIEGPVELVDVAPTILGLLDIPIPPRMRGTDLGPYLLDDPPASSRLAPAFAELQDQRMIAWGKDKLICQLARGYCRAYDLAADPAERHDLAETRPDLVARLQAALERWLDEQTRLEHRTDVMGGVAADADAVLTRARMGNAAVAPELVSLLAPVQAPAVRREAARLLARLPPRPQLAGTLAAAMRDADSVVAEWAAIAALRAGAKEAAQPLVRQIVDGPDAPEPAVRERRAYAALALAWVEDHSGVPILTAKLGDCSGAVDCRRVIETLGALRDERAVPALLEHLVEVENRREIVEALGAIGDRRAVRPLADRLVSDEYVPVRAAAARALGRIGGVGARTALASAAKQEKEAPVLAAIEAALSGAQEPVDSATQRR